MRRTLASSAFALCSSLLLACASEPLDGTVVPDTEDDVSEAIVRGYTTSGTCDGLPRVTGLELPPGMCLGVAARGFKFTRGLAELPSGEVVVVDMGGWARDKGTIHVLRRQADRTYRATQLLAAIDKPSGVAVGPDGLVYVGTPDNIFRFDAAVRPRPRIALVARNLPTGGRHPLVAMAFDRRDPWTLYVNSGSATDVCEVSGAAGASFPMPCPEAEGQNARGVIRRFDLSNEAHTATTWTNVAYGLRNSMALAVHPTSNVLLQGENSRDSIDKRAPGLRAREVELPHEELNVIREGAHYGWPYCYDNNERNPEYPTADCSTREAPAFLLPGHGSPLGMEYYTGTLLPAPYRGQLLVGLHGYRALGHRLVLVPVDATGVPTGAPLTDVIRGWDQTMEHPTGTPVDVMVARDGAVWISEDRNGTVLRLWYDAARGNGAPMTPRDGMTTTSTDPMEAERCRAMAGRDALFTRVQRDVIDVACVSCHGTGTAFAGGLRLSKCDDIGNARRLLGARPDGHTLVVPGNAERSELYNRMRGVGYPRMPAEGLSPEQLEEVTAWIRMGAPIPQ